MPATHHSLVTGITRYAPAPPGGLKMINDLPGCVPDAHHISVLSRALPSHWVRPLTDNRATVDEFVNRMDWVGKAPLSAWSWRSSHGAQIGDRDADEQDGLDEVWCAYDNDPDRYWDDGILPDDGYAPILPPVPALIGDDLCHSASGYRDFNPHNPHQIINRAAVPPLDVAMRRRLGETRSLRAATSPRTVPLFYIGAVDTDSFTAADYYEPECPLCATKPHELLVRGYALNRHGALSMAFLSSVWRRLDARFEPGLGMVSIRPRVVEFGQLREDITAWFKARPHFNQMPRFTMLGGAREDMPTPGLATAA